MPWEIDYVLLTFSQLKKSKYHLSKDINITIDSVLNLSSYIINWEESKLPKEFFIQKYNSLSLLLKDYNHNKKIYQEDKLYGHLELQRECIGDFDYYMSICPDMYFSEHLLYYMIESAKNIKGDNFVITPQTHKLWDGSWDVITDPDYLETPYKDWDKIDIFDLRNKLKTKNTEISLQPIMNNKWAGWFDLYSKSFYEDLVPIHQDWCGYGPWDWYGMMLMDIARNYGLDFQQFLLKGQTIFEYSVGPLKETNGFSQYYRDMLVLKDTPNQREIFESKMQQHLDRGIEMLKEKNIINNNIRVPGILNSQLNNLDNLKI